MMRMIPPMSSASEMGLFIILMVASRDQDARKDLRPLWGVAPVRLLLILPYYPKSCGAEVLARAAAVLIW